MISGKSATASRRSCRSQADPGVAVGPLPYVDDQARQAVPSTLDTLKRVNHSPGARSS